MLRYNKDSKEIFTVRNQITLQAAILKCSEAAVHSNLFSKICQGNTGGRVLLLVKLQTDCSEWRLYNKMAPARTFFWKSSAWTVQKQLSKAIHFENFSRKYRW